MLYYVIHINMPNCFLFLQQWSLKTQVTSVWSPSSCPEDSVQSSVTNEGRTPVINLYYEHDGKSTTSEELAFSSEWSANATTKKALAQLSPSQACSLPLSISALGVHSQQNAATPEIKLTRNQHKNGKTFGNEIEFMRILHLQILNLAQPSSELISIYLFIGWYCDNNGIFIHDQDLFPYLNHIHVHKLFTMAVWGMYL